MRHLRDLLCALALAASTAVSVWAAVRVARQEFPDPATLEPVDVRQWLVERDLTQASPAVRSRVARRLETELRDRGDLASELRMLDAPQRQRLEENLSLVMEQWFRGKVNRYFEQSPGRRTAWLDREIGELERLFNRGRQGRGSALGLPGSLYMMGLIGGRMEQWIQRADTATQERMREFQRAVNERLLARQVRGSKERHPRGD
jgi:hypothetical protein